MATFPTGLHTILTLTDNTDDVRAEHPNTLSAEIRALEDKVGVNGSAITNSHDYLIDHLPTQIQDWDAGGVKITAETLESDVSTGTAPFTIASTTKVTNLNAATADGFAFRSGDLIMSSNVITPTGWTDVSSTYNDKFIRISSGTALTTGGTDTHAHTAGSFVGPNHRHVSGMVLYSSPQSQGAYQWVTNQAIGGGQYGIDGATLNTTYSGTGSITGTSTTVNNIPAYVQTKMYKKD